MARPVIITLAAFMIVSPVLCGSCRAVSDSEPPIVFSIYFYEPITKQANVTTEQDGTVNFTGAVRVDNMPVGRVIVSLFVAVAPDWTCSMIPSSMYILDSREHLFNVTVTVPKATLAGVRGHVFVNYTADGVCGPEAGVIDATVTIAPYYNLSVVSERYNREILPQDGTIFIFNVQNIGNSIDSYNVEIVNARQLTEVGWQIGLSDHKIVGIPPKGNINVTVTVRPPQGWSWDVWISRTIVIQMNVSSLRAEYNKLTIAQTFQLQVNASGTNNPLLEMLTTIILLIATGVAISVVRMRRKKRSPFASANVEN